MVRVVSAHHFDGQIIQTCEDSLAICTAPPDRLLIALPQHIIEVRDIELKGQSFSFPTIDRVSKLSYCASGNYVATLETKQLRNGKDITYTRVYTNWDRKSMGSDDQAMRARIAGRVTPSSSQTGEDLLEMIELPVKFPIISTFTCCQETGNILVGCEQVLCLFQQVTKIHDISRLKFLDFELWPVTLELSFAPLELSMSEDIVAAVDATSLHVFRINKGFARPTDWSSSTANSSPRYNKNKNKLCEEKNENNYKLRPSSPIRFDKLIKEATEGKGSHETQKLSNGDLPVLAFFPELHTSQFRNLTMNLRASPFKPPDSVTMGVAIKEIPANEPWAEQMTTMVESLLQLELGDWTGELGMKEKFQCLALRPQYSINHCYPSKTESSCPRLRSPAYCSLVAFNCLICTQYSGYMYHFPVCEGELSLGKCITHYNFLSPIKCIVLEPYVLHVITSTSLETYTLRTMSAIQEDKGEMVCPPLDAQVFLVGVTPFMGVKNLLISHSYLILLSSDVDEISENEVNMETIYCLKLPSAGTFYSDLLAHGIEERFSNPLTFAETLFEAHSILSSITEVNANPDFTPSQMEVDLYKESCAVIAEFYILGEKEEDWNTAYLYTLMAQLGPIQVLERLKKLENEAKRADMEISLNDGLTHFLKLCLISCDEDENIPVVALNTLLDLVERNHNKITRPFLLSELILESSILRQFSSERTIRIISKRIQNSLDHIDTFDCLALAVLYITKGKLQEAGNALSLSEENDKLAHLLQIYWTLLFDNTRKRHKVSSNDWDGVTLSELSVLLIDEKPLTLAQVLSSLVVENSTLRLQDILQVFLTYLPSRMGVGGTGVGKVLQIFLESVFHGLHSRDQKWMPQMCGSGYMEALKILMRSLLGNLVGKGAETSGGKFIEDMFGGKRPEFLELLPPFSYPNNNKEQFSNLLKLQCLLCSGWLDDSTLSELAQFVTEFLPEDIAFSLLVLAQPQKAVEMITTSYPRVLPVYTKEMLKTEPELKHLITLIQSKADDEVDSGEEGDKIYTEVFEEVLKNLARSLSCDVFTRIIPPGKEFEGYITMCQQTAYTHHLKDIIAVTGERLLAKMSVKSFT